MIDPEDYLFDGAETYAEKNDDYGDSWRKVGEFLYQLTEGEGVTLETKEDFISFGLFTRRLDKVARAFNGEFLADEMNFESIEDAHFDEMVYAAMSATNQSDRDPLEPVDDEKVEVAIDHPTVVPDRTDE